MPVTPPGPRVLAALGRQGLHVGAVQALPSTRRTAWRLELDDGRICRLRRLPNGAAAARIDQCLRGATPDVLPRALGRVGPWLATEFVPGTALDASADRSLALRGAARLMAAIHASPHPRHRPTAMVVYKRAIALAAGRLQRTGKLSVEDAARLKGIIGPTSSRSGLTHGDLSAGNLITARDGKMCVVDEERVAVRPQAYDIARAICLWEMSFDDERAFLAHYEHAGGDAAPYRQHRNFWIAAALSTSVLYRMRYQPSALAPALRALRALCKSLRRENIR